MDIHTLNKMQPASPSSLSSSSSSFQFHKSPFQHQVDPVPYDCHPHQSDGFNLLHVEPYGEQQEEGVVQICCHGDWQEVSPAVAEVCLQIVCTAYAGAVKQVHYPGRIEEDNMSFVCANTFVSLKSKQSKYKCPKACVQQILGRDLVI